MNLSGYLFTALLLLALPHCASQPQADMFPQISQLDRVWQDESGALYSVIKSADGALVVHEPATGYFFTYRPGQNAALLQSHPADAPHLELGVRSLQLGVRKLRPLPAKVREIHFENDGTSFYGMLTIPQTGEGAVPLVVNTQGSERTGALAADPAAAWYARAGFATFIFDKRGTGRSGGSYTHDFELLASDLEAAIAAVVNKPDIDSDLVGLGGYSQGVYVGTLVASRNSAVKFLIAGFGVMESPIREDFLETRLHFEAAYPGENWQEFSPFVLACEQAFALGDSTRWREVSRFKRRWKGHIDPDVLAGTLTGDGCLRWPPIALRLVGSSQFPPGLDWSFDPVPLMAKLNIPVLFQYGEADLDAPPETSVALVEDWIAAGKPFNLLTYPGAVHGMYMSTTDSEGNAYRYKNPDYIAHLIEWLSGIRDRHQSGEQAGARS